MTTFTVIGAISGIAFCLFWIWSAKALGFAGGFIFAVTSAWSMAKRIAKAALGALASLWALNTGQWSGW